LPVVIQIEIGELDRSEVLDPEGASLPPRFFVVLVSNLNGG